MGAQDLRSQENEIQLLQQKINQFNIALKSARVVHWEVNLSSGKTVYVEDPGSVYGTPIEQLPRLSHFMDIVHAEDRHIVIDNLKHAAQSGIYVAEFRIIWPDGSIHWLLGKGAARKNENGELIITGINLDITERKLAELEVKSLELQLEATFKQAAVGIAHVSPKGELMRVNAKFAEITGFSKEELQHKTFQDITHPDDLQLDLDLVQQVLDSKINFYTMEKRYIRPNKSIVWVNLTVTLVRHPDGRPNYFISVIDDITELKEDQLAIKELTNELEIRVRTRTMELEDINLELENFLYLVSQNIKQPVQSININVDLLQEKIQHIINSSMRKCFDEIAQSSSTLNQMAQNLLGLSRVKRGEFPFITFPLREAVDIALADMKSLLDEYKIKFDIGPLEEVFGNKALLGQFFQTIIRSILEKHPKRTPLHITIDKLVQEDKTIFYIRDNSVSLSFDRFAHAFELNNTQSQKQMGLYISKSILKRHHGSLWIEPQKGWGHEIRFTIG